MKSFIRTLSIAGVLVALLTGPAWAWTATYSWTVVAGATSYKVEKSVDNGVTWVLVASPTAATLTYTGAEPGLLLLRISACNANGCTVRYGDGLWHNEVWVPPVPPSSLAVQ